LKYTVLVLLVLLWNATYAQDSLCLSALIGMGRPLYGLREAVSAYPSVEGELALVRRGLPDLRGGISLQQWVVNANQRYPVWVINPHGGWYFKSSRVDVGVGFHLVFMRLREPVEGFLISDNESDFGHYFSWGFKVPRMERWSLNMHWFTLWSKPRQTHFIRIAIRGELWRWGLE
jgi:hypothetical protein